MPWNPLDPALADDPYPRYDALRSESPTYFEPAFGWYFVTGHDEAQRVLREPGGEQRFLWFQEMRMGRDVSAEPYCEGIKDFVMASSPEDHKRIRSTFQKHFTPKRVQETRAAMERLAHELVDGFRADGRTDIMKFAATLPLSSISAVLALSDDEQTEILGNITHFKRAVQFLPMDEEALAKANATILGLERTFEQIVARRRGALGDDLLSMLIREADAGHLTEDEVVANAWGLFAGGFDTTAGAIGTGVIALVEHPEQLARLREDRTLLPDAVRECLRYAGPVQAQHRVFDHPVEVGDVTVPPDTPVINYLIAANRDPRWVDQPDDFRIDRAETGTHLAYGDGKRKCPGRHLANMTIEVALDALCTLPGLRADGHVEWDVENLPALMPLSVPVAWDVD